MATILKVKNSVKKALIAQNATNYTKVHQQELSFYLKYRQINQYEFFNNSLRSDCQKNIEKC